MAINDLKNAYALAASPVLASKLVWAGLAYSLALRLSDDNHDAAIKLLADEWGVLHANGIIPQKPRVAAWREDAAVEAIDADAHRQRMKKIVG